MIQYWWDVVSDLYDYHWCLKPVAVIVMCITISVAWVLLWVDLFKAFADALDRSHDGN